MSIPPHLSSQENRLINNVRKRCRFQIDSDLPVKMWCSKSFRQNDTSQTAIY